MLDVPGVIDYVGSGLSALCNSHKFTRFECHESLAVVIIRKMKRFLCDERILVILRRKHTAFV